MIKIKRSKIKTGEWNEKSQSNVQAGGCRWFFSWHLNELSDSGPFVAICSKNASLLK